MAERTILIRADASAAMGTGHVMRCLALAQAWQDSGGQAVFAVVELLPSLHKRLLSEGMDVVFLNIKAGSRADSRELLELANQRAVRWIVVDGYHFDSVYQNSIKEADLRLLFVDDAGKAGPYSADVVLNQNLHATADMYTRREAHTKLLLGTSYIMLRRDFKGSREVELRINPVARRLLVSMGGSDPDNITAKVVEMLRHLEVPGWEAIALLGPNSPYLALLTQVIRDARLPIRLMENVTHMAELMQWADLAVTAGGTTIWELAFMGVPIVAVTRGEHERRLLQSAARQGIAKDAGPFQEVGAQELGKIVARLAFDQQLRGQMSKAGRAFVDGLGAARVVDTLGEFRAIEEQADPGNWVQRSDR